MLQRIFTTTLGFEAIRTLGGSPIAVAVPPMFENMTLAISTRTGSEIKNLNNSKCLVCD
jgi:hypothetical protein